MKPVNNWILVICKHKFILTINSKQGPRAGFLYKDKWCHEMVYNVGDICNWDRYDIIEKDGIRLNFHRYDVKKYFCTLAEWRDIRIDEILND
jgi:hypothetical protein